MVNHRWQTKEYCIQGVAEVHFEEYISAKSEEEAKQIMVENLGCDFDKVNIISIEVEESKYD